jgi:hypothetical protein
VTRRQAREGSGSPAARLLGPLAGEEGIEVEWCRRTAAFAGIEGFAQCPQLSFAVLKQPQRRAHDVTGRPVAARGDLAVDEGASRRWSLAVAGPSDKYGLRRACAKSRLPGAARLSGCQELAPICARGPG